MNSIYTVCFILLSQILQLLSVPQHAYVDKMLTLVGQRMAQYIQIYLVICLSKMTKGANPEENEFSG